MKTEITTEKHPITGAWNYSAIQGGQLIRLQWFGSKRDGLREFKAMLRGE